MKEVIVAVFLLIFLITGTVFFINNKQPEYKIDDKIISDLIKDVSRLSNFVGIIITSVDIQSNSQQVIYYYFADSTAKVSYENYFGKTVANREPFFLKDKSDKVLNDRLIKIINHEFVCTPYSSVLISKITPDVLPMVDTVCGNAIPPSTGEFFGTINIYLSKSPSADERALLRAVVSDISDDITNFMRKLDNSM